MFKYVWVCYLRVMVFLLSLSNKAIGRCDAAPGFAVLGVFIKSRVITVHHGCRGDFEMQPTINCALISVWRV